MKRRMNCLAIAVLSVAGLAMPLASQEMLYGVEIWDDIVAPGEVVFEASASEARGLGGVTLKGDALAGFGAENATATWNFIAPEAKYYHLDFDLDSSGTATGDRLDLYIDGKKARTIRAADISAKGTFRVKDFFLSDGTHELTLWQGWKGLSLRGVKVVGGQNLRNQRPVDTPVNPNATVAVRKVMKYLADLKGKGMVAGQMDLTWDPSVDMLKKIEKLTGKLPGLAGFDFLGMGSSATRRDPQVEEAVKWWNRGGLVAFCWHWRMGRSQEFYTDKTDYRINRNPDSQEYKDMIKTMDNVARQLKILQDKGVAVLWRPLHEASGGWFWWGATGPDDYIWLWRLMYDRFTNLHKLDNLIWVYNGQNPAWYPGNDVVDVIGEDIYPNRGDHSSQLPRFVQGLSSATEGVTKIVALTENGTMPDPDNLIADSVGWAWFMTWNDTTGKESNFWSDPSFTSDELKKKIYTHPYVITLDELPSFRE